MLTISCAVKEILGSTEILKLFGAVRNHIIWVSGRCVANEDASSLVWEAGSDLGVCG